MAPKRNQARNERKTSFIDEQTDGLEAFLNSVDSEHRNDVEEIINLDNFSIYEKLEYLEDHLTVRQLKTCRRLLEEQESNFKKYLSTTKANLVDKMLPKGDFDSVRKMIKDNAAALKAFQNYLKYNGYEDKQADDDEEPEEEEAPKKRGDDRKNEQVETSDDDLSEDERADDSDAPDEELPPPKQPPSRKPQENKKPKERAPEDIDYYEWKRQSSVPRQEQVLTTAEIWQLAGNSQKELNGLKGRVKTLEIENERLRRELEEEKQKRKKERDEMIRYHADETQRLKDQHLAELAAVRRMSAESAIYMTPDD